MVNSHLSISYLGSICADPSVLFAQISTADMSAASQEVRGILFGWSGDKTENSAWASTNTY